MSIAAPEEIAASIFSAQGREERGNTFLRKDGTYLQTKRGLNPEEGSINLKRAYACSSNASSRESSWSNSSSG